MKIEQYMRCWTKLTAILNAWTNVKALGAFECASYCLADTREEALAVAGNYNAILRERIREYRHPISIHGIGRMRRN